MRKIYAAVSTAWSSIAFLLLFVALLGTSASYAQTPAHAKDGGATGNNTFALGATSSCKKVQLLYQPSNFTPAPTAGTINRLYFMYGTTGIASPYTITNLRISLGQTTNTGFSPATEFYTGLSNVLNEGSYTIPVGPAGTWFEILLTTPYSYDPTKTLIVEITLDAGSVTNFGTYTGSSITGQKLYSSNTAATTGTANSNLQNFGFSLGSVVLCTAPPTPGTASASTTFDCAGSPVSFMLNGNSTGGGQTYQWETAASAAGPFTPVGTPEPFTSYSTTIAPGTNYFRCAVTCSGQTAYSDTIAVTGAGALAGGTYTINSNDPTGGTNFNSFTDMVTAIKCGILGPVVFNVEPGSGPYTEQIVIPEVSGSSAVNTITINGNNETLRFTSTTSASRALITLDGTDYVTIRNLRLLAQAGSTYGWGVHLTNSADFNTIDQCNIDISAVTSTTAANSGGVIMSGSATSTTTDGSASNNSITNNIIEGGYQGIIMRGTATGLNAVNNVITGNTVRNFYATGIELLHHDGALVAFNDISRAGRGPTTTFAGIELGAGNRNCVINGNRIHDTHNAAESQSGAAYGIYLTGCDAPAGSENIFTNNLIYNFNSTTGTIYGLYNSSSDGAYYYHNTISLDHAGSTSGTTRGIYQLTAASRIEFKNNLISISRGGTGNKHAIYMGTATTTYVSDYNNFFVEPGATNYTGYSGANQATLLDWQTVSAQDANSVSIAPEYLDINTANYFPNSAALDNKGTPVGVTADIENTSRSATTPDIGAYEFAPLICTSPPVPGTLNTTLSPACTGSVFTLGFTGGTLGSGQTYQWQSSPNNTDWTDLPGATLTTYTTSQSQTTYYRLVVTCGGISVPSASLQVVTPTGLAGTYTINSALPTGGTNFQSFNDAYAAMRCGISAAVIFNVEAGSGPYNEQLIMESIPGASSVNTITFNGNGATLSYLSNNTSQRATIKLDGADHMTFDSLVIVAAGNVSGEYGWAIQLTNSADSNTFRRCEIISSTTATTAVDFAGVVISNSPSVPTTGGAECDGNVFDRNIITGGNYGIIMAGTSSVYNSYNRITRNQLKDFNQYGIYISGSFDLVIDSNMISRPTRVATADFTGIYFTAISGSARVSRNTITNPNGGNPTSTAAFTGIQFNACDPLPDRENIVSNNLIYNITGEGNVTGITDNGSNNIWFFHNTVSLDGNAPAATATNFTRGFYQTTDAAGIRFINNIISITRGGASTKHVIYMNTPTSDILSNNNDFFIDAPAGVNAVGYVNANDYTILADWQAASGKDMNSVSNNPIFVDAPAGNFMPTNVAINDIATPVGITEDITGAARSATTPDPGAYEFAPPACVTPPLPGQATVSGNPVCENSFVELGVTGHSPGVGQTYVWQVSSSQAGPYADISGVLENPGFTISASATQYYRVAITCSGNTAYSEPVLLNVTAGLPGGNYTIDASQPASATNFISFNAAKEAMACGITGPVVFDVEPNTGPYNEQLILDSIPGTSSVNTITFNGNGNTIQFSSTNSNERAVIKLVGTDYVTFDSLVIDATGTGTYGWGVQLMNNADSNVIRRSRFIIPATGTSTNFAGIVMSGSATSATGTGNTRCDYNLFEGNTITGGYYGITVVGSAASPIQGNRIINNKVTDYYYYGIYVNANDGLVMDGNDISKPTRAESPTTQYAIYFTGVSSNTIVNANRVHDLFAGQGAATSDVIGIYFTGVDAIAVQKNIISNNAIYNLTTSGYIYGIQNTGSNYAKYYHNTISIDHAASTSTDASRGFYQTTIAEGIEFINNIVTITRGGNGTKHAIYMGTNTTAYLSDNNDFYVAPGANNHIGYSAVAPAGNKTTLADWQAATLQDANSVSLDPQYANVVVGDLTPQLAGVDDIGQPVGITSDILRVARNTTTPDIGAYEFSVIACTTPPVAGTAVANPSNGVCLGETITLNLNGNSVGGFQTYKWQRAASAAGPWTDISAEQFGPGLAHVLSSSENFFRCIVTCNGNSQESSVVEVVLNPLLAAGDYTIDPATPAGPTNFQNFGTAVAALACGIEGPVRFHVVPGTYNEQVLMKPVPNSSATNTVTFMSQDGDPASVTLSYASTLSTANYTLKLDSASNIIYKNMSIVAAGGTYGRAIEMAGPATNDSILNCNIQVPGSTSTATTISGIFATSLTGNDNVIKNNRITNGSAGIHITGVATTTNRLTIDSNTVNGTYYYGIYTSGIDSVRITGNSVLRTGLQSTTTYGIYLTNCDSSYRVDDNTVIIRNTGNINYGIYLTGCQSTATSYGSISGNKVIGEGTNTGNQYGIYTTTSTYARVINNVVSVNTSGVTSYGVYFTSPGGFKVYNNTVQSSATSATNNIAGYFNLTTSANGQIDIRNNIISHTGGGRAMYIGNPQHIISDYNMLYTSGPVLVQWGTNNNFATLQEWRDTSYWDFNSIRYQPVFLSPTDLRPDISKPEVWAMHGRGIQLPDNNSDINGDARPVLLTEGVPDLGAYEFEPVSIPVELTAIPAAPAPNSTQVFMLGTDTVSKVTWGANAPTTVTARRYSGAVPPALATGQDYMYFYTEFDYTGTAPTGHMVEQFYLDPWLGFIPSEQVLKLGRTNAGNTWDVAIGSTVSPYENILTEGNLSILGKYTGLTDGNVAPAPPITVSPSDSSNMGKQFWVSYGHYQDFASGNAQNMLLYLGAGATPANVTVRVNGTGWFKRYTVPANTVIATDFMPKYGSFDARQMTEGLSDRGIHIESSQPITAYAHIYGNTNSGATMLMPVGTYGYEYYAITSKQNYASNTYSWVNVIAAYDSTVVEITPSQPTVGGRPAGVPFTVQLKKGEVYQVLGALINTEDGYDLTGTKVKSISNNNNKCYPIAVFSGSSRTNIGCNNTMPTVQNGDNIIQQNFPYRAWGRKYLTASTSQENTPSVMNMNIYKVAVKDPTTVVKLNGVQLVDLIDNRYYQFESNSADYIEADKPVMVAQILPSATASANCGWVGNGDPEMIYISPMEQGIKQVALYRNTRYNIVTQFLTLIIPSNGVNSLLIDASNSFDHVFDHPNMPGYKVVVKRWTASEGQTFVTSDSAFTAITYGLGSAESYGYNAGTLVKNLNLFPSIANVYNTLSTPNEYTCDSTPVRISILTTVQPEVIEWNLSAVAAISPNADVIENAPSPTSTTVINGVTYYQYTLPQQYSFSAPGVYNIPVFITHPDVEGCNNRMESSIPVTVLPAPVVNFDSPLAICPGSPAQFNATLLSSNNPTVASWSWEFGDNGTGDIQNPLHTYTGTGTYDVKLSVITAEGCVGDTVKQVEVGYGPAITISPDSVGVCLNDNVTFTIQNPDNNAVYTWYDAATGGNAVATGTSHTINNVTANISLWVESSLNGCISETRKRVQVTVGALQATPVVTVDSVGSNLVRFRWNSIAGATGYEVTIDGGNTWTTPSSGALGLTHTVSGLSVGQSVTLQVRTLGGCLPTTSAAVTAQTVTDQVFIPNTFTPNNDGLNDQLRVYSNVIRSMRFMVFNQWGEKIYEANGASASWDGMYKGKPQPTGVYMYVADIILVDGSRIQRKGSVNLVR